MQESAGEEALAKILRVLPADLRERVAALEDSLGTISRAREPQPPATQVVLTLAAAIRGKRCVQIRYATPGHDETDRKVAPYGLVLHGSRWYLAAHDDRSSQIGTFRVDRVLSAELRRDRASAPVGFDAADHVARSLARLPWGWEIEVVLRTTLDEGRRRIPRTVGEPQEVDGGVLLRARTDDLDTAARLLASLGWPFTVRRPEELRASLHRLTQMLAVSAG